MLWVFAGPAAMLALFVATEVIWMDSVEVVRILKKGAKRRRRVQWLLWAFGESWLGPVLLFALFAAGAIALIWFLG